MFWNIVSFWVSYNLVDEGLSRLLGLQTLRHGTGPAGYLAIHLRGADPQCGGNAFGSSQGLGIVFRGEYGQRKAEDFTSFSINKFHLLRDSGYDPKCFGEFGKMIGQLIEPKMYSCFSGIAQAHALLKNRFLSIPVGMIAGIFTPVLKFRYSDEEIAESVKNEEFEFDLCTNCRAYTTTNAVSKWRLGIVGSLLNGVNRKMWVRMRTRPFKVIMGALLSVAGVWVGMRTYQNIQSPLPPVSIETFSSKSCIAKALSVFLNTFLFL